MADSKTDETPDLLDLPLGSESSADDEPATDSRTGAPDRRPRPAPWLLVVLALAVPLAAGLAWLFKPSPPVLILSADLLDFSEIRLGDRGRLELELGNGGEAPLELETIALESSPASAGFAVEGADTCLGRELPLEATCSLVVTFSPTEVGTHSTRLRLVGNGHDGARTLPVIGEGIAPELRAEPARVDLGEATVGYRGGRGEIRLENRGSADLRLGDVGLEGLAAADFVRFEDRCSGEVLAPDARCLVRFEFVPTADGERVARLRVDGDAGLADPPTLTGLGLPQVPILRVEPQRLDFGAVRLGDQAEPVEVTLRNEGSGPLALGAVAVTVPSAETGPDAVFGEPVVGGRAEEIARGFPLEDLGCAGRTLDPGASCRVLVGFAPRLEGALGAVVEIAHDAAAAAHRQPIVGRGLAPHVAYSVEAIDFGETPVGQSSSWQRFEIRSVGSAELRVDRVSIVGVDDRAFSLSADGCTSRPIPPGQSCAAEIRFQPRRDGPHRADLRVRHDASDSLSDFETDRLPLSGVGTTARLAVDPSSIDFNTLRLGDSKTASVRLRNTGRAPLLVEDLEIGGGDEVAIVESCVRQTLLPGSSCRVELRIVPRSVGAKRYRLEITHGADPRPRRLSIEAMVLPAPEPDIAVEPGRLSFPVVPVGERAVEALRVRNPGSAPLRFQGFAFEGGAPDDFEIGSGTCAGALDPGESCTLGVVFRPKQPGQRAAGLVIRHDAPIGPLRILLEGTGSAPPSSPDPPPPSE